MLGDLHTGIESQVLAVKGRFAAKLSSRGDLFPNVQNNGLKRGQCAVRHKKGSYHQFAVRAEEDIPPLLTQSRVARALRELEGGDADAAARSLTVEEEYTVQGDGILYAVLCLWLGENKMEVPPSFAERADPVCLSEVLRRRLLLTRTDSIPFRISIAAIGCADSDGTSVVPEDWLGRQFENGEALCRAIDTLPHRQGLPPAEYCSHYGLKVVAEPVWLDADALFSDACPAFGISLSVADQKLSTSIQRLSPGNLSDWMAAHPPKTRFLRHEFQAPDAEDAGFGRTLLIGCVKEEICEAVPVYERSHPVGILASQLQKCIRQGRGTARTLSKTVDHLRKAPCYNLPDDQFRRSSGSRQLAWRLFISIFEDAEPYADDPEGGYLGLQDLVALGVLAHAAPDLQFNAFVGEKIRRTALLVQRNDGPGRNWAWRTGGRRTKIKPDSDFERVCEAALEVMPMMERDAEMLRQGCDHFRKRCLTFKPLDKSLSDRELLQASEKDAEDRAHLVANDFHCVPAILLYLQASAPVPSCKILLEDRSKVPGDGRLRSEPASTQNLKRFIWENVSRMNVRNPQHQPAQDDISRCLTAEIHAIQKWLASRDLSGTSGRPVYPGPRFLASDDSPPGLVARTAFISLFGRCIELQKAGPGEGRQLRDAFTAIAGGHPEEPFKIKKRGSKHSVYLGGEDRSKGEVDVVSHLAGTDGAEVDLPPAPVGYRWRLAPDRKSVRIRVAREEVSRRLVFSVDGMEVTAFDASCLLEKRQTPLPVRAAPSDVELIEQALYINRVEAVQPGEQWDINQTLRSLARTRKAAGEPDFEWIDLATRSPLPAVVWQRAYTKLLGAFQGRVTIGPVNRSGDKTYAAIDHLYEGTLWRIFNLLSFVFPDCVQPCAELDFSVRVESPSYVTLFNNLERLASPTVLHDGTHPVPSVRTPLWQHQESSKNRIAEELLRNGRRGFGDASDVGAGKTLSSLAVMCEIARCSAGQSQPAEAFLVLVYNEELVQTWRAEIDKHTSGFHFVTQDSAGNLSGSLLPNSILVTTLGRMRDTPVTRRWHLVVIDECLSVQNANALWTQEAWKQVACSLRGVLLLSATLFRSRFNELFYLLRMLRTGLPETREYLDAILSESITCHLPETTPWHWTEETRLLPLEETTRLQYDRIKSASGDPKVVFGRLDALLVSSFPFEKHVREVLTELNHRSPKFRALIFARSKEEAQRIAQIPDISLYPETSGRHIVTTTAAGARGVNDLVVCDTLITRPVDPDLVPQMRGRLGRPGQQNTALRWVWMVAEGTLEEAKLERNRMAERFHWEYVMPLAEFFEVAVKI